MNNQQAAVTDFAFEDQGLVVHRLFVLERDQRKIGGHPIFAPNADALAHPEKTDAQAGLGKQCVGLPVGIRFYLQAGKPHFFTVENKPVPKLSAGQLPQILARESISVNG